MNESAGRQMALVLAGIGILFTGAGILAYAVLSTPCTVDISINGISTDGPVSIGQYTNLSIKSGSVGIHASGACYMINPVMAGWHR